MLSKTDFVKRNLATKLRHKTRTPYSPDSASSTVMMTQESFSPFPREQAARSISSDRLAVGRTTPHQ